MLTSPTLMANIANLLKHPEMLKALLGAGLVASEAVKGKTNKGARAGLMISNVLLDMLFDEDGPFKDPSIGDELKKTPENKEEVPKAPKIPKDKDTVSSGLYTSGIGNLLKINPETFNWGKPPLGRSISPLSGINNLFESSW